MPGSRLAGGTGDSGLGRGGTCSSVFASDSQVCIARGVAELQFPSCPVTRARPSWSGTRERYWSTGPRGGEKWDLRLEGESE